MSRIARFVNSSIGAKTLVALTGAGLFLFVVVHMLGNLQVYLGPDALNAYAKKLKDLPALLWPARLGLLLLVVVHIAVALRLAIANRRARKVGYDRRATIQATPASLTMVWTGPLIAAFVVYHLLHFTFGAIYPEAYHGTDAQGRHDVYRMVVLGFRNPLIALSYIVAMIFLGLHLRHGIASLFQTLGLRHPAYDGLIERSGLVLAWIIVIGNVSIPVSIWIGLVRLPST